MIVPFVGWPVVLALVSLFGRNSPLVASRQRTMRPSPGSSVDAGRREAEPRVSAPRDSRRRAGTSGSRGRRADARHPHRSTPRAPSPLTTALQTLTLNGYVRHRVGTLPQRSSCAVWDTLEVLQRSLRVIRTKVAWHAGPQRVRARTFWGDHMQVILPEALSLELYLNGRFEEGLTNFLLERLQPKMTFFERRRAFWLFHAARVSSRRPGGTRSRIRAYP